MCRGLIGRKLGMMSIFSPEGKYMPVTVLKLGPCVVTQIKAVAGDGYNALQLGFGEREKSHTNKPMEGHLKKSGGDCFALLREISVDNPDEYDLGQTVNLEIFKIGERVNVTGITKGRGFAGVIKRHGFHGGGETHGSHSHRVPGSIGCSAWPAKVIKGKKMPGHYGNEQKTVKNLEIVDIRPEEDLIMLKGAVPGFRSGLIEVKKQKNL
jgi:large subunit ribosomal protein L3